MQQLDRGRFQQYLWRVIFIVAHFRIIIIRPLVPNVCAKFSSEVGFKVNITLIIINLPCSVAQS